MTSKTLKIAPLFLILLMTFSAIAYAPTATTAGSSTATPQIQASHSPIGSGWTQNPTAYAAYNGHFGEYNDESGYASPHQVDYIMTARLTANPNVPGTYSNLSISMFEFFTGSVIANATGLWYNISTSTGLVWHTLGDPPLLLNHPSFFYIPQVAHLNVGQTIVVTTPFNGTAFLFKVVKFETVLGIETKLLAFSWNTHGSSGPTSWGSSGAVNLWISNSTVGLLMRIKGHESSYFNSVLYSHSHNLDVSMEIGDTNIVTLVPPTIPESVVGWMSVGKYIQYNLQGSGYIDASFVNHTSGVTWALPGDTKFRTTVSANVTMKVTKGTTAWVDPWNSTRYMWVVHLMLNNTKLLLPDLDRSIKYLNQTLGVVPYPEGVAFIESILGPFNHTGLVADTWFLVDNATGIMLWPGMHFGALSTFEPTASEELGTLLSEGLGFEILSYFAQSVLYQGWSISNPLSTQTITSHPYKPYNQRYTQTTSGTAVVSITAIGTEYLTFPGGGSGHCWRLQPSVNVHVTQSTMLNKSATAPPGYPYGSPIGYLMQNGSYGITGTGYIDIERTTGFPLKMGLQTTLTLNSEARAQPYFWDSVGITVFVDLTMSVPKTNIWFSNPPAKLIAGMGGNVTTPPGYFGDFGFDVWMSGAHNVSVTTSVSPPPDAGTAPNGTLPFIYLDVKGIATGGTAIILYVYYNRTKVSQLGIDENSLKLYTWNYTSSAWSALETTHLVINSTHGVLFAVLPHLSYFAVLGSPSTSGGGAIPTTYILIAAVAVIVVLAAVVYMKRRRGGIK